MLYNVIINHVWSRPAASQTCGNLDIQKGINQKRRQHRTYQSSYLKAEPSSPKPFRDFFRGSQILFQYLCRLHLGTHVLSLAIAPWASLSQMPNTSDAHTRAKPWRLENESTESTSESGDTRWSYFPAMDIYGAFEQVPNNYLSWSSLN